MNNIGIIPKRSDRFLGFKEQIPATNGLKLKDLINFSNYELWRSTIKGEDGLKGLTGSAGQKGAKGLNAYEVESSALLVNNLEHYLYKLSEEYFLDFLAKYSLVWQSYWDTRIINYRSTGLNQIEIPIISGGVYDFWIEWGDGQIEYVNQYKRLTHSYAKQGIYKISIAGKLEGLSFKYGVDSHKLLNISNWGSFCFTENQEVFSNCSNLTITATDLPQFKDVTSFSYYFANCLNLTNIPNLVCWPWGNIEDYTNMFLNCIKFEEDLSFLS